MATFGDTSIEAAFDSGDADAKVASKYTLAVSATVTKLTAYLNNQYSGHVACYGKAIIYDGAGSYPVNLKAAGATTAIADNKANGWVDFVFGTGVALNPGSWWLGLHLDANAVGVQPNWSASGGASSFANDTYSDGTAATWGSTNTGVHNTAIYATYTVPADLTPLIAFGRC